MSTEQENRFVRIESGRAKKIISNVMGLYQTALRLHGVSIQQGALSAIEAVKTLTPDAEQKKTAQRRMVEFDEIGERKRKALEEWKAAEKKRKRAALKGKVRHNG